MDPWTWKWELLAWVVKERQNYANKHSKNISWHLKIKSLWTNLYIYLWDMAITMTTTLQNLLNHSYDILGAGMLWKPEEARILKNFINQRANIR
jgi:hypothetical protein